MNLTYFFVLLGEILPKKVSLKRLYRKIETNIRCFLYLFCLFFKIKSVVTLMALEVLFVLAFILTSLYPTLTEAIGAYNVYFIFAGGYFYHVFFNLTLSLVFSCSLFCHWCYILHMRFARNCRKNTWCNNEWISQID